MRPNQLIDETDRQLTDLKTVSLEAIRAIQDFVAISRALETASRQLISESQRLLVDTGGIATRYKATVYAPPRDEASEPRFAA